MDGGDPEREPEWLYRRQRDDDQSVVEYEQFSRSSKVYDHAECEWVSRHPHHGRCDSKSGTDGSGGEPDHLQCDGDEHRVEQSECGSGDAIFLDRSSEQRNGSECGRYVSSTRCRPDSSDADGEQQCGRYGNVYDHAGSVRVCGSSCDRDGDG